MVLSWLLKGVEEGLNISCRIHSLEAMLIAKVMCREQ